MLQLLLLRDNPRTGVLLESCPVPRRAGNQPAFPFLSTDNKNVICISELGKNPITVLSLQMQIQLKLLKPRKIIMGLAWTFVLSSMQVMFH